MQITITTSSGIKLTAPTEKWVIALLVAIADVDPLLMHKIFKHVEDKADIPLKG